MHPAGSWLVSSSYCPVRSPCWGCRRSTSSTAPPLWSPSSVQRPRTGGAGDRRPGGGSSGQTRVEPTLAGRRGHRRLPGAGALRHSFSRGDPGGRCRRVAHIERFAPRPPGGRVTASTGESSPPPVIPDETLHTERPSGRRAFTILVLGLGLWFTPVVLVALTTGPVPPSPSRGCSSPEPAVVTFGGAYAVLSYVTQKAVDTYRWVTLARWSTGWPGRDHAGPADHGGPVRRPSSVPTTIRAGSIPGSRRSSAPCSQPGSRSSRASYWSSSGRRTSNVSVTTRRRRGADRDHRRHCRRHRQPRDLLRLDKVN